MSVIAMEPPSNCSGGAQVGIKRKPMSNSGLNSDLEKRDAMRTWQEMKANGFVTPVSLRPTVEDNQAKKVRNERKLDPSKAGQVKNLNAKNERKLDPSTAGQVKNLNGKNERKLEASKAERAGDLNGKNERKLDPSMAAQVKNLNGKNERKLEASKAERAGDLSLKLAPPGTTIPTPKKPRENRRRKDEGIRNRVVVQGEDRFSKTAAPTGLLSKFDVGIINRIRSREQVFAVLETLVRRGNKMEDVHVWSRQAETERLEGTDANTELNLGSITPSSFFSLVGFEPEREVGKLGTVIKGVGDEGCKDVPSTALTLSTSDIERSSLLNEQLADRINGSSVSVEGHAAASEWLQCVHRDIKRRLAALHHNRIRVAAVMHKELPCLLVREFSCNQRNEELSAAGCPVSRNAELHRAKWTAIFGQLCNVLNKEESLLVHWLEQVKEMQSSLNKNSLPLNG
ncbi:hypothetical protein Tsubulata_007342 [Turnera subulata]|uniref:Uncharacterized protein n=1 Tax=Turnera subulata TaxID=218843 RepID=A0A9Q0FMU4_9ROSI|nr:hypothetical protein Tsubulata_007342 [Turnera subulata]